MSAGIGAMFSLLNMALQERTNSRNIQNQNELFQKQIEHQDRLNANGALMQKQGLERAGLNVLSQFGPNMNLQAPTPSMVQQQAPQADSSFVQLLQQQPLIDAQVRKLDAERQETLSRIPLNDANTRNIIQNTANALEQNGILKFQNATQEQQFYATMANLFADTQVKAANAENVNWDNMLKDLEYQLEEASLDTRKQIYAQTLADITASAELKQEEKRLTIQKINESVANVAFTNAQIHRLNTLLDAEFKKLNYDAEQSHQQGLFIMAQASMVRTQQEWIEFDKMLQSLGISKKAITELGKLTPFGKYRPKTKTSYNKSGIR